MKLSMLILPLFFIVAGYIIYRKKFKIDKQMYDKIIADLAARGDIQK
jgi:melibiose permease/lactose/raffinose/galactose permease